MKPTNLQEPVQVRLGDLLELSAIISALDGETSTVVRNAQAEHGHDLLEQMLAEHASLAYGEAPHDISTAYAPEPESYTSVWLKLYAKVKGALAWQ